MPKTTFRVRQKQWDLFNRECKAASLRRDDLLDRVLPDELLLLSKTSGCDEIGYRWLKGNWMTTVDPRDSALIAAPVLLSQAVLDQLNAVCTDRCVPRDAFVDCALYFLTKRLYEAVIVIKKPRTSQDLVGELAEVLLQAESSAELNSKERDSWINETVEEWWAKRNLNCLADDFYDSRLSYNIERLESDAAFNGSRAPKIDDKPVSVPKAKMGKRGAMS